MQQVGRMDMTEGCVACPCRSEHSCADPPSAHGQPVRQLLLALPAGAKGAALQPSVVSDRAEAPAQTVLPHSSRSS